MAQEWRVFFDVDPETPLAPGTLVNISDTDSHHLRDVLRRTPGDAVTAIHRETGKAFRARINSLSSVVSLEILEPMGSAGRLQPVSTLLFSLARQTETDLVCEKACELGVNSIILFEAAQGIVRGLSPSQVEKKVARIQRIVESAAKQCGQNQLPEVSVQTSLHCAIEKYSKTAPSSEVRLCCSLSPQAIPITQFPAKSPTVAIAIGPAADFSAEEELYLQQQGFKLVGLGPYTLRSETAAICSIAMVQAIWNFAE